MDAIVVVAIVAGVLALAGGAFVIVRRSRAARKPPPPPNWLQTVQGAVRVGVQAGVKARELAPVVKDSFQSISALFQSVKASDLQSDLAPDGTITILFSDIEDSTALNARLGDDRWLEELRAHTKLVQRLVEKSDGHVVKSQGDGFMIAFKEPRRSTACAIDLQRALDKPSRKREPLRVRVGVHTGRAISEAGDFFGENVAFAARVTQQALGGEILVSAAVKEKTEDDPNLSFSPPRRVELKGIDGLHEVFNLDWRRTARTDP